MTTERGKQKKVTRMVRNTEREAARDHKLRHEGKRDRGKGSSSADKR